MSENAAETEETGLVEFEPSGKQRGAIEVQSRAFEPSPLALLSEDDFDRRIQLAQLECDWIASAWGAVGPWKSERDSISIRPRRRENRPVAKYSSANP